MTIFAKGPDKVLPVDMSAEFPGYACLLGNLLEAAALAFAKPDCSFDLVSIGVLKYKAVLAYYLLTLRCPDYTDDTWFNHLPVKKLDLYLSTGFFLACIY